MQTVIKCSKWEIYLDKDGFYRVKTAKNILNPWKSENADFLAIEDAIEYCIPRFINIQDSQLTHTHIIKEPSKTYIEGSDWRIAVQDDCYTVQWRESKTMMWTHNRVSTIATYGNLEGALLRIIEKINEWATQ
jgi:hypothetical protein